MMGVYEIINIENGRSYVGSSVNIKRRWREHVGKLRKGIHPNKHLQRAWNNDGEGAFSFCVLERINTRRNLRDREQFYLDILFDVDGNSYNIGKDARASMLGIIPSEESRRKMSISGYNRPPMSEETKQKIGKWSKNWKRPPEVGKKISQSLMGKKQSPEHREKNRQARLGVKQSEETKRKKAESIAKPYPAFIHRDTGEIIPAGHNLTRLSREKGLSSGMMRLVKLGKQLHHRGWMLLSRVEE